MNLTDPQSKGGKIISPSFSLQPFFFRPPLQCDPVTTHTSFAIPKLLLSFFLQSKGQTPVKSSIIRHSRRNHRGPALGLTISQ